MIRIKIVPNDLNIVAKAVILDEENRVLFLKRSKYVEKYSGDWDLPGGHLKENESLEKGLTREVKEETGITISSPVFFKSLDNLNFFHAKYESQEITLSNEHIDYRFFDERDLNSKEKFQKIALEVLQLLGSKNV